MNKPSTGDGFTLLEILVVLAVLTILLGLGGYSYLSALNPPREIANTIHGRLLAVRTDAMANTQARRVLLTDQSLTIQTATRCGQSDPTQWVLDGEITFEDVRRRDTVRLTTASATGTPDLSLPTGAQLVTCFTSRGLAQPPAGQTLSALTIKDSRRTYNVEVAIGGGVRTRVP